MKNTWKKKAASAPSKQLMGAEELSGVIKSVVYHSDDTGYSVCTVSIPERREPITIVGNCASLWVGENIKASGEWIRHPSHGYQFQAKSITCIAPTSAKGIERYLASGMIKGIGKVNAKRIVEAFGKDTLRVIEKESKRLENVEGIGTKRRKLIKESWIEQHAVRDIMIFLQGHGIGTAHSTRIYRQYGNNSIAIISNNPYRLCSDIWGIGFKTADAIAGSVGIPAHSLVRARAGLVYVMHTITQDGHCFCPIADLLLNAQELLDIPVEILSEALMNELAKGSLIKDSDNIYIKAIYDAEHNIAVKINSIAKTPSTFKEIKTDKAIAWAENLMKVSFAPMQAEALQAAMREKISVITGGPGVGKTTIIRALVEVFSKRRLTVALAAPTGRAAKRMEEATNHEAKTIHRLLKFLPNTGKFDYGPDKQLNADVFILDEVSMIDVMLMNSFLSALPSTSCLVLVGDTDQLPSIGPGNVLRDIIGSGNVPFRKLETIFRQETTGLIVKNAHLINNGEDIITPKQGDSNSDFYFIETLDPDDAINKVINLITNRIPKRFGLNPMTDIQVLTPMRRNQLGAENLNAVLQEALNPNGVEIMKFGRKYRLGDRVMQIRNNYDKEIFNGDIGRITNVDTENQIISSNFDDRIVTHQFSELDELIHAYACSIHKSQGSEYPAVIILMTTQHFKLLQRNLLYTAITRGKKLVCLVGTQKAVGIAIRNNETRIRRTNLMHELRNC